METAGHTGGKTALDLRFFAPADDLQLCFRNIYRLDVTLARGQSITDYLQPAYANLRFTDRTPPAAQPIGSDEVVRAGFSVTGPSSKANRFTISSTCLWGFALSPIGWSRFIGRPAKNYANGLWDASKNEDFAALRPLKEILRTSCSDPEAQVAEACDFLRGLAKPFRDEKRVAAIQAALEDPHMPEVRELASRSCVSVRTLERICARHFGFAPRVLLRRQRVMRSLAAFMLSDVRNWNKVIDPYYHDQAHFVHEFYDFMGMSPSEYASMPHPILDAFMAEQRRVWGSPAAGRP